MKFNNDAELLAYMGTDAHKWAVEFLARYDQDCNDTFLALDNVRGWFANAIGAGQSAANSEYVREWLANDRENVGGGRG